MIKKKALIIITKILVGSGSTVSTSAMGLINPGAGIFISSSTALLTSIVILITNEYINKLKIRYTKLRDWINVIKRLIIVEDVFGDVISKDKFSQEQITKRNNFLAKIM